MTDSLKIINPEVDKRWDEFVCRHPQGLIYHHSLWEKVLVSTFRFVPFYTALENDSGQLTGVIPFLYVNSRLTGKRLVSLPFTSYSALLVPEPDLERVAHFAIRQYPDADFLELKFISPIENASGHFEARSDYVTHILNLDRDQEALFKSFHNTSIRQRIKRAEKNNLKLRIAETEQDLKRFFDLHIAVRKKHGLPPHPYAFFSNMWHFLKPRNVLTVPLIEYRNKIIAGAILLGFNGTFHLEYSSSDQGRLKESPNQLLIWEAIKIACNQGGKYFDFGRSSLTNNLLIEFKERWGTRRINLEYYYHPKANRMDTENGRGRRALTCANRFLPNSLLRLEGEIIYRHIG